MSYLETHDGDIHDASYLDTHDATRTGHTDTSIPAHEISAFSNAFHGTNPDFMRFGSRRSVVHSTKGIVSSTEPLASRAGIRVLQQGGNAADAAVACAAALNVTEPSMCGIGGDMFCLFYDAKTKKTHALNGSGRSGANVTLEQMRKDIGAKPGEEVKIPYTKVQAVTVPGAAAGLVDAVAKFGSGKVTLEQVLAPAIELAEEGFPVSELCAGLWARSENLIRTASPNFAEMLKKDKAAKDGVRPPKAGEIFKNPTLGNTLRLMGKHGKKGFYEGEVAEKIIKVVTDLGGRLTLDDLKHHAEFGTEEVDAISLKIDGLGIKEPIHLWEHPPNGQGLVALIAMGVLLELEKAGKIKTFTKEDHNSVEYLHAIIEALRLGFSDATHFISDPNVVPVPIKELLSPKYLADRASAYSKDKAIDTIHHGTPLALSSDTVYFSTSDPEGNACSFIMSNYAGFGTAIIPEGCGFTLQNRGANFALQPEDHPNVLAPRKRPYHTIIPAMITNSKDQSLNTCYGVMGGYMQPQGHVQVLMNMFVFGLSPQEALDSPRICIGTIGTDSVSKAGVDEVYVEEGIRPEVVEGLKKLGHNIVVLTGHQRQQFGRGQVIRRSVEEGQLVWSAGSDLRGDGHASPL